MVWRMTSNIRKLKMWGAGWRGTAFYCHERLSLGQWVNQIVSQPLIHIINCSTSHPLHQSLDQIKYSPLIDTCTCKEGRKDLGPLYFVMIKIKMQFPSLTSSILTCIRNFTKIQYLNENTTALQRRLRIEKNCTPV